MSARVMTVEEFYSPNKWLPFGAAMAFHVLLLMWDPTILKASPYTIPAQLINIKMLDHLPMLVPPKPIEKKHVVKKAKKSGLSMHAKSHPARVVRHSMAAKPKAAPKPFFSKITIPKFVPTETDESIAASPVPGMAPAARERVTRAQAPAPKLSGKTRGVRASDVHFSLSDRGTSLTSAAEKVVSIPIAEERGDQAVLPSAAVSHSAPAASRAIPGYHFTPGTGGVGELSGKDRSGSLGYHGAIKADSYVEGSLQSGAADGRGGKVVSGKGFEIGGPVGDRKITARRLPEYPVWAEEKGITALVKIYFTVKADGSIRSNIRVLTSSGYAELDDLAKQALMAWRFSPTSDDSSAQSAWGVITFRFTLS